MVHAVAGSPSIAWAPVDCGSPVSRRFDVAVATPASRLRTSSAARSLRRSVTRGEKSRSEPSVKSRTIFGSGSLRHLLSGIGSQACQTRWPAESSPTTLVASVGNVDNLGVRAEAELGEPDRRRPGIGRIGAGDDAGDRDANERRAGGHRRCVARRPSTSCRRARRLAMEHCRSRVEPWRSSATRRPVAIATTRASTGRRSPRCSDRSGLNLSPTTHAVDGSPSTAIAGRSSGR